MNITLAHEILQECGYCLEMRDIKQQRRTICHVYANNGQEEHLLCTMTRFATSSTKAFRAMIKHLPTKREVTA